MQKDKKPPVFIAFDLETTGFDPKQNKIIEIGALKFTYDSSGSLVVLDSYSELIDPEQELSEIIQQVTGITPEDLKGKPKIEDRVSSVAKFFADCDYYLGHNVNFDISFLSLYIELNKPTIDSQFFTELLLPGLSSYSLDVLPFELGIDRGRAHRAYDDSVVSAEVFLASLKQFIGLSKDKQKRVISLFKRAKMIEARLLETASETVSKPAIFRPRQPEVRQLESIAELEVALAEAIKSGSSSIITHPASAAATQTTIRVAQAEDALIILKPGLIPLPSLGRLPCEQNMALAEACEQLSRAQASLVSKYIIAGHLDSNYSYLPKISPEEKAYSSMVLFNTTCLKHDCGTYRKVKSERELSHYDFWKFAEIFRGQPNKVVIDFDEAAEVLASLLQGKFTVDSIPQALAVVPQIPELQTEDSSLGQLPLGFKNSKPMILDPKIAKAHEDCLNTNDLFWGLFNIENLPLHLTAQYRKSPEYQKLLKPAQKLLASLKKLAKLLAAKKSPMVASYSDYLTSIVDRWQAYCQNSNDYHYYAEDFFGEKTLRISASSETVSVSFQKLFETNAVLTAGTGSEGLNRHYVDSLKLSSLPQADIQAEGKQCAVLKVADSEQNNLEAVVQLLVEKKPAKTLIVAKNVGELELFRQHLTLHLGGDIKIITLDKSGSGASKAFYKFANQDKAVLIIPPRGKALTLDWPKFGLAVISSIPFPPPEPALSFMESSYPKAMLAHKSLLAKILASGDDDLEVVMLDKRLTGQKYGQNFVELSEQMCGCRAEKILL